MGRSRFHSTGPLGPIARTAEFDLSDAADNLDTYYLRDAHGGHVGLLTDHHANLSTPAQFSFTTYDAFGNAMRSNSLPPYQGGTQGGSFSRAGSFSWRGAEGSVYDAHPTLVYMQARHYDPTIGRFIQPDSLALASLTTQGMNRYIYCENDPVNLTDPTGHSTNWGLLFVLGGAAWMIVASMALAALVGASVLTMGASAIAAIGLLAAMFGGLSIITFGISLMVKDRAAACRLDLASDGLGLAAFVLGLFGADIPLTLTGHLFWRFFAYLELFDLAYSFRN